MSDTPKGPSVLDQWEAKAQEPLLCETASLVQGNRILANRILSLISVIHKKDEKFLKLLKTKTFDDNSKHIEGEIDWGLKNPYVEFVKNTAEEALALTGEYIDEENQRWPRS